MIKPTKIPFVRDLRLIQLMQEQEKLSEAVCWTEQDKCWTEQDKCWTEQDKCWTEQCQASEEDDD